MLRSRIHTRQRRRRAEVDEKTALPMPREAPTRSPVSDESHIPGGLRRTRSRTSGTNLSVSSSSPGAPGQDPLRRPATPLSGRFPTSAPVPAAAGSNSGAPSKARPRRCSSHRSTSRGDSPEIGLHLHGQARRHHPRRAVRSMIYHFILYPIPTGRPAPSIALRELREPGRGPAKRLVELGGVPRRHRTDRPDRRGPQRPGIRDVHPEISGSAGAVRARRARRSGRGRPTRTATASRATTASSAPWTRPSCCAAAAFARRGDYQIFLKEAHGRTQCQSKGAFP